MSHKLQLISRMPDPLGRPMWHDAIVLLSAIGAISKGKSSEKMYAWISIAGKIQEQVDEKDVTGRVNLGVDEETGKTLYGQRMCPIEVELRNQEAHLFWQQLEKLNWGEFGINPQMSGTLCLMLKSIATQLGEKWIDSDADAEEG